MKTIYNSRKSPGRTLTNQEKYEHAQLRHHRLVVAVRLLILFFSSPSGNWLPIWDISMHSFSAARAGLLYVFGIW